MPNEEIRQARRFGRAAKDRVEAAKARALADPSQENTYLLLEAVHEWEFALAVWRVEFDCYVAHPAQHSSAATVADDRATSGLDARE